MAKFKAAKERGFVQVIKPPLGFHGEMRWAGVPEMQAVFEALPGTLQRKVLREVLKRAGTVLISHIRKATPRSRKTGTQDKWSKRTRERRQSKPRDPLAKGLKKKPSSQWKNGRRAAKKGIIGTTVGIDWKIAPHAYLVEHGHRAFYWSKKHSGERVEGHPYFYKAVKKAAPAVQAAITKRTRQRLAAAVVRHVKGKKR